MALTIDISALTGPLAQQQQVNARNSALRRQKRNRTTQAITSIAGAGLGFFAAGPTGAAAGGRLAGGLAGGGAAPAGAVAPPVLPTVAPAIDEAGQPLVAAPPVPQVAQGLEPQAVTPGVAQPSAPGALAGIRGSQFNPVRGLSPLQGAAFGAQLLPAIARGDAPGAVGAFLGGAQQRQQNVQRQEQAQALSGVQSAIAGGDRQGIASALAGLGPQAAGTAAQLALGGGGSGDAFETLTPAQAEAAGFQQGAVIQRNTRTNELSVRGQPPKAAAPVTRRIVKDASGFQRYADTGARVFPSVAKPVSRAKLPPIREIKEGDKIVTQELQPDGETYIDIATADRFREPDADTIVTLQPPTGSAKKNTAIRVGSKGGRKRIDALLDKGYTQISQSTQADVSKPTTTAIEKKFIGLGESEARLESLQKSFDEGSSRFFNLESISQRAMVGAIDKVGLGRFVPDGLKKDFQEAKAFFRESASNLNLYIKEITGAQMSEKEATRLINAMPDAKRDGLLGFESKLKSTLVEVRAARARYQFFLETGQLKPDGTPKAGAFANNPLSDFISDEQPAADSGRSLAELGGVDTSGFNAADLKAHNDALERALDAQAQ